MGGQGSRLSSGMTRRLQATGLAIAGFALLVTGPLVAPAASRAAASTMAGCAWALRLDPNVVNFFYPDQAANYWITELPAVPGETLTIRGKYPHGRYISFTSYDGVFRAVDGLSDQHILADPGSTNPFFPHALRTAVNRLYTVHAVFGQRPPPSTTQQQNNYLYTTSPHGSHTNRPS